MTTKLQIEYGPPSSLKPNPWNSNVVGPEMELRLEASVKRFDVYKPIIVRELEDGTLQILGGEHRCKTAARLGYEAVPYVNLGRLDDRTAKEIGLADNGRYGEDDALRLAAVLRDLGEGVVDFLPFQTEDLAGMFAAEKINLDDLGFDDGEDRTEQSVEDIVGRATITHELMRFKVPVESRERVEKFIARVIKGKGLSAETDPLIAAGMALVEIVAMAEGVL